MLARLAALAVIAIAGLTATAASAAVVAYTKSPANLREGPGTKYAVITTMPKNTMFMVEACTINWCAGESEDGDVGFVAKSLLKKSQSGPDIPFSIQIIIGPEGPFVEFGDLFVEEPDEPDPGFPEVCFYQQANFKGANFCVEDGDEDTLIPGSFNNNIESILITGGLKVEVCSGSNYGGDCFYYSSSKKSLPSELRNRISSYAVSLNDDDDEDEDEEDGGNVIILN